MPNILIRDLDSKTIKRLKARAAGNKRSFQAEVKEILQRFAAERTLDDLRRETEKYAATFKGRKLTDTVSLLREDRRR